MTCVYGLSGMCEIGGYLKSCGLLERGEWLVCAGEGADVMEVQLVLMVLGSMM